MFVTFADLSERRRYRRREVSWPAMLDFGSRVPRRPCTLADIADGGARLNVGLLIYLPQCFSVLISSRTDFRLESRLVWSSEFEVGIEFL
jgi:hypothetical protein